MKSVSICDPLFGWCACQDSFEYCFPYQIITRGTQMGQVTGDNDVIGIEGVQVAHQRCENVIAVNGVPMQPPAEIAQYAFVDQLAGPELCQ